MVARGGVTFTPALNFNGSTSFLVQGSTVANDTGTGLPTVVTVNVTPVNDPPVPMNDEFLAFRNVPGQALPVLANDNVLNPDGPEALTIVAVSQSNGGGTVTTDGAQVFFTPRAGFLGCVFPEARFE